MGVEFSGCGRYIDTPVKRYSSGMTVRLAFAVAAFLEPDILVIDEVLAVGDAEFQKKAIGKMQEISKGEGRTVLFVSHNMAAVQSLCTRGIVLEHGKIVYEGNQEEAVGFYISKQGVNKLFNRDKIEINNPIVFVKNISIKNKEGNEIDLILAGERIEFTIEINKGSYSGPLSIGLGIYNDHDEPQIHCSSEMLNHEYFCKEDRLFSILEIKKWPLVEGNYYINVFIRDKQILLDYIKECYWLNVGKGDFYGKGKLPSWKKGFYIDYEWK